MLADAKSSLVFTLLELSMQKNAYYSLSLDVLLRLFELCLITMRTSRPTCPQKLRTVSHVRELVSVTAKLAYFEDRRTQ